MLRFVVLLLLTFCAKAQIPCSFTDDASLKTDQAATFQSCINSAPNYSTIAVQTSGSPGQTPHVRINSTITINGRTNVTLTCPGGPILTANAPGFYWGGSDGGTMLNTSGSSHIQVIGCNFVTGIGGVGTTGANVGILVDISSTVSSSMTTTDQLFENDSIYDPFSNSSFIGIHFSPSGDANVEFMRVTNTKIVCSQNASPSTAVGIGIRVAGVTFDAIRHHYQGNTIIQCGTAIYASAGLPTIDENHFENDGICVTSDSGPMHIFDNDAEGIGQFFFGGGGNIATLIEGNRIASCAPPSGQGCIYVGGVVISRGNGMNTLGGSGIPIASPSNGIGLITEGDLLEGTSSINYAHFLAGAETFYQWEAHASGFGWGILLGGFQGGSSITFDCNRSGNISPAASVMVLCANGYTERMQLSENGGEFLNLLGSVPYRVR